MADMQYQKNCFKNVQNFWKLKRNTAQILVQYLNKKYLFKKKIPDYGTDMQT